MGAIDLIITFAKPLWFWLRTRVRPSASAVLIAADAHFCKCKRNSRLLLLLLLPPPHPRRTTKLPADASECAAAARAAGGDAMLVSSLESLPSTLPAARAGNGPSIVRTQLTISREREGGATLLTAVFLAAARAAKLRKIA